jgi:hypothetical protein
VISCVDAVQYKEAVVINELLVCDVRHVFGEYFLEGNYGFVFT